MTSFRIFAKTTLGLYFGLACMQAHSQTGSGHGSRHNAPINCDQLHIEGKASSALNAVTLPPTQTCTTRTSNGFPIPDPSCTPGAVNPTVTLDVLQDTKFRTRCVRDQATTEHDKTVTYDWYKTKHPSHNSGASQTCELDHLVSLELGGADTLDNIWPQCGPHGVGLPKRFFKQKDLVENFLASEVRAGRMSLNEAQKGIAKDWTQFLADAKKH